MDAKDIARIKATYLTPETAKEIAVREARFDPKSPWWWPAVVADVTALLAEIERLTQKD